MKVKSTNSGGGANYYESCGGYRGPYAEYEQLVVNSLNAGDTILDVGCGRTFPMAEKWLKTGARVFGLDPVIDQETFLPEVEVVRGKAEKISLSDETFNLIVSRAVLEHLEQPQLVFQEFHRLLKPNGRGIFLTPSKYDYVSFLARIVPNRFHGAIVNVTEGRAEADTFTTYYRANSRKQLTTLAVETGFVLEKIQYLDQSPYALKFNPLLYKAGCWYHRLIRTSRILDFLNGWILCVVSKPKHGPKNSA